MDRSEHQCREHRVGLPPIVGPSPSVLILGTIPSVQSALKGQYYGNPQNHFWRLMADVLGERMPEDYSSRCDVLRGNGIAVWDVLAECDIRGSGDNTIINPVPNDVPAFVRENRGIHHIFVNGQAAFMLHHRFYAEAIKMSTAQLPSSSPANAIRYVDRRQAWLAVRDALRS